jgi:tight adherence protein C
VSFAVLLAAAAGCCAAFSLADFAALRAERRAERTGSDARRERMGSAQSTFARLRAALLRSVAAAGRRVGAPPPVDLDARIAAAGEPWGLGVGDVMALKWGGALAGAVSALAGGSAAPGRLGLAFVVAAPVAGFLAPDLALRRRARARAAAVALELADVVELLRVAVGAGLTPQRAVADVGRRHAGLLAKELRRVAAQVEVGAPGEEALDGLRRRVPVEAVGTLTQALRRSATHGAPLQPALAALALQARAERTRAVKDRAARAAPQIQLVVALLLVPAVLLLVAAALAGGLL